MHILKREVPGNVTTALDTILKVAKNKFEVIAEMH